MSDQTPPPPEGPQFNPQSGFPVPPPSGEEQPPNPWGQPQPQQPYPQQPYGQQPYPQQPYGQQPYPQQPYPQQGYQPYGYPSPYGYAAGKPELPQATTALVLGLVGVIGAFFTCGLTLFVSPFAWVLGAKARRTIEQSNGQYDGRSKATTGFVMGIIGTVLLALALIALVIIIVAGVNGAFDDTNSGFGDNVNAATLGAGALRG